MAIASAISTSANVSEAIKSRFYRETFLTRAEENLVHKQLGQLNVQVPQGAGGYGTGVVYWTRFINLPEVTAGQGEGVPTTCVGMSAVNVTGSTAQYDAGVSISDILKYTSFGDMMKQATELLGYNAGVSIDNVVRDAISNSLTPQIATGLSGTYGVTAIPSTGVLSITEIRKAIRTLSANNATKPDGGFWLAVVHPYAVYDLQADTTTGGWTTANTYRTEVNGLLNGELGKLMGTRFLESSNAKVLSTTSVVGSGSVYETQFLGKEAFGVTNLQDLSIIMHGFGSGGVADPTDKVATAGWKTTFGATVLNSAFGVNIQHCVTS
jgi:N4-gp56 family major capsid protein